MIAEAAEQKRKRRIFKVLHPKVGDRSGDGSERNYRRSLGSLRDACYCGLQVKIRRDDSDNYPPDQQHSDEFEPALHGKTARKDYSPKVPLDCQKRGPVPGAIPPRHTSDESRWV